MARHRSPQGRRAHLTPPLSAIAAAGAGGAHRTLPVSQLTTSFPVRFVATAVAGGALAAVGQHALVQSLPATGDGTNVLRLGVQELFGKELLGQDLFGADPAADLTAADPSQVAVAPSAVAAPLVALAPVVTAPETPQTAVLDAAELVKATDIQRQLTDAGTRTADEQARAAATAAERAADTAAERAADTAGRAAERAAAAGRTATEKAADKIAAGKTAAKGAAGAAAAAAGKADASSLSDSAVTMISGRVTSGFGSRWGTRHQGLDIAAPIGTPIRVPFAGTVIDSGPASGFGLWVRVRHGDGTVTTYGHINRSFVSKGQQVTAGQKIAEVGNRGQSTGPHLHIEVTTPGGAKINPRPWLDQHGVGY